METLTGMLERYSSDPEAKEIIDSQSEELDILLEEILYTYECFIKKKLIGNYIRDEIEKQYYELFPGEDFGDRIKSDFIKMKIIYESLSSFLKIVDIAWNNLYGICKVIATFPATKELSDKINSDVIKKVDELNKDTRALLAAIEEKYGCRIVGTNKRDKRLLVSNILFEEGKDYAYSTLFDLSSLREINKPTNFYDRSKQAGAHHFSAADDYYFTAIVGTKEWNRNDAYLLYVKKDDLKEEEKKFYSSSFITLNPSEELSINMAAAMVRKNSGNAAAPKYSKMLQTLVDFVVSNIMTKDFGEICDDPKTFLYHIGPLVVYNIIQEDMNRRDFGNCFYVDNNKIIKLFPENIIKKHIIDHWVDKFFGLKPLSVDSYMNYSKGVATIRESYKQFFDMAASTRKRNAGDNITTEEYVRQNVGKFFGYRRAQVYRRFVQDNVFGLMPEVNSSDLINKFYKK